jgi:hypothetical protein
VTISIDWPTKVISVPKVDTLLVTAPPPQEIRALNMVTYHLTLRALEASEEGIVYPRTHNYVGPISVGSVSLADVVEIINGYTNTFEDGQYAVNLNGANTNLADVTNVNQVSVRPNNSAGLTFSKEVEDQSFTDARVWINTITGTAGTAFPIGTPGTPVNNLTDAATIIALRNLPKRLFLRGVLPVPGTDDISDYDILGSSNILAEVQINANANTDGLVVEQLTLSGDLNGQLTGRQSTTLVNTVDLEGTLTNCGIEGTLAILDGATLVLDSCFSETAGIQAPIIVLGTNSTLIMRNYSGGVELRGMTAGCVVSVDLDPGRLVLDDVSNVGGEISVKGTGDFVTTPAVVNALTYDVEGLVNSRQLRRAVQSLIGKAVVSLDDLTVTIYDEEGDDVLQVLDVSVDERTRTPQ